MHRSVWLGVLALVGLFALPSVVIAQSSIAGQVKDESGAVLPGVTVEAASPALIEKVLSAVSDDQGRYRIVNLRPGTYKLTFTLTGFSTLTREDLPLSADQTLNINADMKVGSLEETSRSPVRPRRLTCSRRHASPTSRATSSTRCRCRATSCRSAFWRPACGRTRPTSAGRT